MERSESSHIQNTEFTPADVQKTGARVRQHSERLRAAPAPIRHWHLRETESLPDCASVSVRYALSGGEFVPMLRRRRGASATGGGQRYRGDG